MKARQKRLLPPPLGTPGDRRTDIIPGRQYSFEMPPDPISDSLVRETVNTEVLIVGGGISGMAAAVSAAQSGARVTLIEKMNTFQSRGFGNGFIGSRLQKQLGIRINIDEVVLNLMKYGTNKPDQRLIRMWAEKSGETADWLMDMTDAAGIQVDMAPLPSPDFDPSSEYYPEYPVCHIYNQRLMVQCLMDNAVKKGAVINFNICAQQLIKNPQGRITGIIAHKDNGDYLRYNASKAVVICTGDYAKNSEMMAKYCPQAAYLDGKLITSTGDGHRMALWAGAVMEPAPHSPMSHGFPGPLGADAFLQVNLRGERFHNEDVPGQSYTNAVERQPGQQAWQVFDSKYPDEVQRMGYGNGKVNQVTDEVRDRVEKTAISALTIKKLAAKMEVPLTIFQSTIERYNELARKGKDLDFGKRSDRLTTMERPPFYACKGTFELLVVLGGLNVNTRLQPLDKNWQPIPGLFVAGNMVGNFFAIDYPLIAPGLSHGMALVTGRIVGLNAASSFG